VLEAARLRGEICGTIEQICRRIGAGAGAAVLAADALDAAAVRDQLASQLRQPPLPDFPLVVLTHPSDSGRGAVLEAMGNVTLVDRSVSDIALASAVRAALRSHQAQYALLQQTDRHRDRFLSVLAHELRNPLAAMRNAVHVMRLLAPAEGEPAWTRDLIERQVQHLAGLADGLTDVSRISRGKLELRRQRVELSAILTRAVEMVRPQIDGQHLVLDVTLPPTPLFLEADMGRLVQVVGNLLGNAAKFSNEGARIGLSAAAEETDAVVRVRDWGMGIPREMLGKIFDLFVQAESSPGRADGMGIGLSLVKGLVELHGGSVEAHSAGPGQGSEFILRLPMAEAAP
jgi:signal transduction histidine kinase